MTRGHKSGSPSFPEMKLILASASPRRAQILGDAGMRCEIVRANVSERRKRGETARSMTRRLALAKAQAVVSTLGSKPSPGIVVGADTIVEVNGELLGKPRSPAAAREMLRKLSGRTHRVMTSIAAIRLPDRAAVTATETTRVRFAALTADEIAQYVATREPLDKAGAYAVQGIGGRFIEGIDGCYFNVVGLPLARLYHIMIDLGWRDAAQGR
jgi:nucleoside triphosphate pyrophosphatase